MKVVLLCKDVVPEVAINTNLLVEGSPLVNRRTGVDCTKGAVNVNACHVSVPKVAINTNPDKQGGRRSVN